MQLTVGVVSALEKQHNAMAVSQFRPIVIYPMLYRIWSSFRAKQFLGTFKSFAPSGVRGGVPARQARSIWYEISLVMEHAYLMDQHCIGIVADLVKAFNQIPREPIWMVLALLGCPEWFINSWMSFVTTQTRRFRVRSSVGPGIGSDVGYPEGCALSVVAMALIDHLLDCWMQPIHPTVRVLSFVDDWQILHKCLEAHEAIVQAMFDFVAALIMQVDRRKSFVWATAPSHRGQLRQFELPVVLSARDLGAQLNFCLKKGNKVLVDRIQSMGSTWRQLRACLSPYRLKIVALRMMAWPRALHGISAVSVGPLNFGDLRTGALRGVRQDRVGANPALHLPLNGFTVDPEGWSIMQSIKDSRELGHPDYLRHLVSLFAVAPKVFPANGPISILIGRVHRLGWTVTTQGLFQDSVGAFDLFTCSLDAIKSRIAMAWPWVLLDAVSHRRDFQGIQEVDLGLTCQLLNLNQHSESDKIFLRCCLDGTMVTMKDRGHWDPQSDGTCPHCGKPDSYYHRAWECAWFEDCRQQVPDRFLQLVPSLPQCTSQHAWALAPPSKCRFWAELEKIPSFPPDQYSLEVAPWEVYGLFTDGSCCFPRDHNLRLAGWAVSMAQPWINRFESHIVAAGHVPGVHQTAFRAELLALTHSLRIAQMLPRRVRIWTDCKGVVLIARAIQKGRLVYKPNSSHSDLWKDVVELLDLLGHQVSFHQVFSHNRVQDGATEVDSWACWHNNLVDLAAGGITTRRSPEFWSLWKQLQQEVEFGRELHRCIMDVFLRVAHKHVGHKASRRDFRARERTDEPTKIVKQPQRYYIHRTLSDKFGEQMCTLIHEWWAGTGQVFLQRSEPLQWISFAQLFADFQMTMGVPGPVFLGTKWYSSPDIFPADRQPTWGQHSRWFQLLLKNFWKANNLILSVKSGPPESSVLQCWMVNVRLIWDSKRLFLVDAAMRSQADGCIRIGKHIHTLAHFPRHSEMGVLR